MRFIKPLQHLAGTDLDGATDSPTPTSFLTDSSQRTGRTACSIKQSFDPLGVAIDVGFDVGDDADIERMDRNIVQSVRFKPSAAGCMSWQ